MQRQPIWPVLNAPGKLASSRLMPRNLPRFWTGTSIQFLGGGGPRRGAVTRSLNLRTPRRARRRCAAAIGCLPKSCLNSLAWRTALGVWTFRMGQPGGLADGSRWSPKGVGAATTGSQRRNNHAPRRGARPATTAYMFADVANLEVAAVSKRLFWQPSGLARLPALGKRSKLQRQTGGLPHT